MTFLLAIVGLAAIGFLLWRAFGPAVAQRRDSATDARRTGTRSHGPVGPDDDADFLRDLDRRTRGPNDEL
ncbi:hypothetical protein [Gordonia aichiensis]|uniref:Uncharacterized protein n=1 Tax=Gordonia aichiensis NBRC 108223 TaxID=1220583 RepID=L7KDS6_9ACTN|nr:hypothetical protein [Gordonia aichiensis]GAC47010.1 hypothetical protein GOACH_03_00250 [Gordonia aichiensis NBRC 108223]